MSCSVNIFAQTVVFVMFMWSDFNEYMYVINYVSTFSGQNLSLLTSNNCYISVIICTCCRYNKTGSNYYCIK